MTKSKSKTFPKGTELGEMVQWLDEIVYSVVATPPEDPDDEPLYVTEDKYLITITKIEEK